MPFSLLSLHLLGELLESGFFCSGDERSWLLERGLFEADFLFIDFDGLARFVSYYCSLAHLKVELHRFLSFSFLVLGFLGSGLKGVTWSSFLIGVV